MNFLLKKKNNSPKLVNLYTIFRHMCKIKRLKPLAAPVIIIALDGSLGFLEANVVKTGKRCPTDVFNGVIGN